MVGAAPPPAPPELTTAKRESADRPPAIGSHAEPAVTRAVQELQADKAVGSKSPVLQNAGVAAASAAADTKPPSSAAAPGSLFGEDREHSREDVTGSRTPKYWSSNLRSGNSFVILDKKSAEFRRVATMVRSSNRNKEASATV